MTQIAERLKSELSQLSTVERAELAHFLLDSLPDDTEPIDDDAWDAELMRRFEEIKNGTAIGEPASSVIAELREKYS